MAAASTRVTTLVIECTFLFRWCCRRAASESLSLLVIQNMLISLLLQIRSQYFSVDWVPPTMSALNDDIKVVWVVMHVVLLAVLADCLSNLVLHLSCNRMLGCIHVRNLGVDEPFGEFFPRFVSHIVVLSNVQAPNLAGRLLQDSKQMKHLLITHSFVKVLERSKKETVSD